MLKKLHELVSVAKSKGKRVISVAAAHDEEVLEAIAEAVKEGLVSPILYGNKQKIEEIAKHKKIDLSGYEIEDVPDDKKAAELAVKAVSSGRAQMIMKGLLSTNVYLGAILNKEWGLRSTGVLSHVMLFESPIAERVMCLTDAAMNVAPDLKGKVAIIENAISVMHKIGFEKPKVAVLAAIELVNADMPATTDAAILAKMSALKQIKGAIVDGPFAFDNAVSKEAAKIKGIESPVAGDSDILVTPDIEAGNVLYKSIAYFVRAKMAAIIVGAKAPVILTSRADTHEAKFLSIALATATA
ncbi:MAG TPA: bifunctional enoyl-CoA hydratase/phosphate acetyltransferase [Candidatus Wallbacteria bacterium]|nr:MAG: Phosphate acetyltransferase [bacterium ADurb.Bin243]HOD40608.1 bifunctional enoyl-CoA hydratase/phosphate acetyltransferase [Candidatus Wallbacteria bacterium]HOT74240.1 bifunctional enoyl-CoA hydratase/phosphate acetyltransferase [Candidatus Wallbacteria bacterium]HPG56231.1 bifunctional enoyl-CoA hydratase/phosphate acetyltransferase [Candidatus Wallbacteria bacterium]